LQVKIPGGQKRLEERPLLAVARRWPRMLLVGMPGSGKSLALWQLAATWAMDDRAPVPIRVSLGTIARRCTQPGSLTLSVLCETAAHGAPSEQRDVLAGALEELCADGGATLLLDGLDECLERRVLIADELRALAGSLPPGTGVIVATRASGEQAAARLGLPVAIMASPKNLDSVMRLLLEHAAQVRVPESDRASWLASRISWLDEARWEYREMSSVPLLATLLVLVAADSAGNQLPGSRAELLRKAVMDSVRRWETQRAERDDRAAWPTDGQLLDGYAAIGHRLADAGEVSVSDAETTVAEMLVELWELAPRAAAEKAEQILWFWDEHVGVFVKTDNGVLAARSRVFCEIASAMWVASLPQPRIAQWVTQSLRDPERSESLQLAAELESKVIEALVTETDADTRQAAALTAAEAVHNGMPLPVRLMTALMDSLEWGAFQEIAPTASDGAGTAAASPYDQERRETVSWACARELAGLLLPAALRERRRSLVAGLRLTSEQRTIATALCALSEAEATGNPLGQQDEQAVRRALGLRLPREQPARRSPEGTFEIASGPSPLTGHVEVAIGAAKNLESLDGKLARRIHEIGSRSSFLVYPQVAQALASRGHRFSPAWTKTMKQVQQSVAVWNNHPELPLLQAAARLSVSPITMSADAWRLTSLLDLFAVLGAPAVSARDLLAALTSDTDETRDAWLSCAATVAGLDTATIAVHARQAISEAENPGNEKIHHILHLILTPPPGQVQEKHAALLDIETQSKLIGLLSARSDWIADTSGDMLCGTRGDHLHDQLLAALTELPPPRRRKAAFVAAVVAKDRVQAAADLLHQPDPAARAGAAQLLSRFRAPNTQARQLLLDVSKDNDLTIRLESRQPYTNHPEPTTWSCSACAEYNNLAQEDCQRCGMKTRPVGDMRQAVASSDD
jgi:hypothetical protein